MNSTDGQASLAALTEKEKQALRLIVRGHDAKSIARDLDLSVHMVNERLRGARRKLAVGSSREAARMLLQAEAGDTPPDLSKTVVHDQIGADSLALPVNQGLAPVSGVGHAGRVLRHRTGVTLMTIALGLLALATLPQLAPADPPPAPAAAAQPAHDPAVVDAARRFVQLLDAGDWDRSYQATGSAFRQLNSLQVWTAASLEARAPLGAVRSRTFVSQENLPAPPAGYEVVKFRSRFAGREGEVLETVTLDRENGGWSVVGITIG